MFVGFDFAKSVEAATGVVCDINKYYWNASAWNGHTGGYGQFQILTAAHGKCCGSCGEVVKTDNKSFKCVQCAKLLPNSLRGGPPLARASAALTAGHSSAHAGFTVRTFAHRIEMQQ